MNYLGFVNTRMSHIKTNPLPEGTGYCICGVNPTVGVQNILNKLYLKNSDQFLKTQYPYLCVFKITL